MIGIPPIFSQYNRNKTIYNYNIDISEINKTRIEWNREKYINAITQGFDILKFIESNKDLLSKGEYTKYIYETQAAILFYRLKLSEVHDD